MHGFKVKSVMTEEHVALMLFPLSCDICMCVYMYNVHVHVYSVYAIYTYIVCMYDLYVYMVRYGQAS